jgi:Flp pilus assembly pilin Flp
VRRKHLPSVHDGRDQTAVRATRRPIQTDDGSIATEYGPTLLLIALAIISAATAFGLAVAGLFDRATIVIPVSGS